MWLRVVIPLALGLLIALMPAPQGLNQNAWYFFAVFAAVVAGLILEPVPAAAIGFLGVFLTAGLGLVAATPEDSIRWALSGFSNTTVWLIFAALMFALGYEKTGLGKRLALVMVKAMGKSTLGLGYAITFADLLLSPFIASNTARSGGIIFPVIRNLPGLYNSHPGPSARMIGSYIMWTAFAATCVTSSMFVTAFAPNLLALELIRKSAGIEISWSQWLWGFLPVGCLLIFALPYLIYLVYPPKIRSSFEVPQWAGMELEKMGILSTKEIVMGSITILALCLWIFGRSAIDPTAAAGIVICIMLVTGVVTWDDILAHKQAWNVLVWFATLVALADGLARVGFVTWFAQSAAALLSGMSPEMVMIVLVVIFFAIHYLFATVTAHATAILPIILAAGAAVPGLPLRTFALLLCYSLGLMGVITPYAGGPGPVYFASGYLSRRDFWTLGFFFGVFFLLVLLGVETPYLLR